MTFTEVSAGIGMFAAAFEAAGMVCTKLVEPNERALQLAVKNCSVGSEQPSGLADVDPVDMLWTHGEIGKIFGSSRVDLEVDEDDDRALRDYGNGGPLRMVLPFADALVSHFAPPSDFVPQSAGEIVSGAAVTAFRGAMDLTHADFLQKAKLN
jgi:hypothetical protein